jgi:HEAT repeat protein
MEDGQLQLPTDQPMYKKLITASVLAAALLFLHLVAPSLGSARDMAVPASSDFKAVSLGDQSNDPQKGKSLDETLTQLKSPKVEERQKAAQALWADFNMPALRPEEKASLLTGLLGALKDANSSVRSTVAHALNMLCGVVRAEAKQAVPALVAALRDTDPDVRGEVSGALGGIGPDAKAAVPALVGALKDPDTAVRAKTAWALGAIGSDGKLVVPALAEALGDKKGGVRLEAAYALGSIGPEAKAAIPALKAVTDDKFAQVRIAVRLALWRTTGDENFVELAMAEAVKGKEGSAALGNATAWLAKLGPPAVPPLQKNLKHAHPKIRADAALALELMQPPPKQAVRALAEALKDSDPEVRQAAAAALRAIDPEAAKKAGVESPD